MLRIEQTLIGAAVALLAGCKASTPPPSQRMAPLPSAVPAETSARLKAYEKRYGPMPEAEPRHEFRQLQGQLLGATLPEVKEKLGPPASVYVSTSTECWTYENIARDGLSGRIVPEMDVWAEKGTVLRITTQF